MTRDFQEAFWGRRWPAVYLLVAAGTLITLDYAHARGMGLDPGTQVALVLLVGAGMRWLFRIPFPLLGWSTRPLMTWAYWRRTGLILLGVMVAFCAVSFALLKALGYTIPTPRKVTGFDDFVGWILAGCIFAPLVEEAVYRGFLVPPVAARVGTVPAILTSGALFAGLHYLGGQLSPDNFLGGFLLAWALIRSRCLLVPILLHAAWNLLVGFVHLAVYHWPSLDFLIGG